MVGCHGVHYRCRNQRGDIAGIRRHVPYLKGLGITAVLFYPMFENDERDFLGYLPTGYRVRNYDRIDPNFGSNADFAALTADLHSTTTGPRLNVILDLPIAMTGFEHPWRTQPERYPQYYRPWDSAVPANNIVTTNPVQMPYGPVDSSFALPIINAANGLENSTATYKDLRDGVVFGIADRFDIDGFRYDSVQNLPGAFWKKLLLEFRLRYSKSRPGFLHIGELVLLDRKPWQLTPRDAMGPPEEGGMDGIYDFGLISRIQDVFAAGRDARELRRYMETQTREIEHPERTIASIDNYEEMSFLKQVKDDNGSRRVRAALAFLMTINRVPFIYSGNEYAVDYTEPDTLFAGQVDDKLLAEFRRPAELRNRYAAFRRGAMKWLIAEHGVVAYTRTLGADTFLVLINTCDKPVPMSAEMLSSLPDPAASTALFGQAIPASGGRAEPFDVRILRKDAAGH